MSIDPVFARQLSHPDFRHDVAFCDGEADFLERACGFVYEGLRRRQATFVAVPVGREEAIERDLGSSPLVRFVDIRKLGRNPSRIIPAIAEFVREAEGRPSRFLCEPRWPGQSGAEIDEVARHEVLVDPALCSYPVTILSLLPEVWGGATDRNPNRADEDLDAVLSVERWPLERPPPAAQDLRFADLGAVRECAQHYAERARLEAQQIDDLVLAVNEVASNSVRYGSGGGGLHLWTDDAGLICEIDDTGVITDPLVGRRPPGPDLEAPGLWLVNQVCDLVQIRSGPHGTRVRMRVSYGASRGP